MLFLMVALEGESVRKVSQHQMGVRDHLRLFEPLLGAKQCYPQSNRIRGQDCLSLDLSGAAMHGGVSAHIAGRLTPSAPPVLSARRMLVECLLTSSLP